MACGAGPRASRRGRGSSHQECDGRERPNVRQRGRQGQEGQEREVHRGKAGPEVARRDPYPRRRYGSPLPAEPARGDGMNAATTSLRRDAQRLDQRGNLGALPQQSLPERVGRAGVSGTMLVSSSSGSPTSSGSSAPRRTLRARHENRVRRSGGSEQGAPNGKVYGRVSAPSMNDWDVGELWAARATADHERAHANRANRRRRPGDVRRFSIFTPRRSIAWSVRRDTVVGHVGHVGTDGAPSAPRRKHERA